MALLTLAEFSVWLTEDPENEDLANLMIEAASEAVMSAARQPTWTASGLTAAPVRARHIAAHLAVRSYKNLDSVQAEGTVGPIGGDRIVEELAKALHLTDAERAELEAMAPVSAGAGSLWILPTASGTASTDGDVYLADNSGSDWHIPYAASGDAFAFTPES